MDKRGEKIYILLLLIYTGHMHLIFLFYRIDDWTCGQWYRMIDCLLCTFCGWGEWGWWWWFWWLQDSNEVSHMDQQWYELYFTNALLCNKAILEICLDAPFEQHCTLVDHGHRMRRLYWCLLSDMWHPCEACANIVAVVAVVAAGVARYCWH